MQHVRLHREIAVDELSRIGVVRDDAPDLGGGEKHVIGPFALEESAHRGLIAKLQLGMGSGD